MKKVIPVLLLLALAGGILWWTVLRPPEPDNKTITLYGNIEIRDAHLSFNEQEHIAEVMVEEGDAVEAGDILARLQTDRLKAMVAEAQARVRAQEKVLARLENGTRPQVIEQRRAEVAGAQARLTNAEANLERLRKTARTGASSDQALDDAQAQFRTAEATVQMRKEALSLAEAGPRDEDIAEARAALAALNGRLSLLQVRLRDAELKSPAAGTIQSRILEPGEMAAPNRPVLTLALTDPKWVRAYVSEPNLGRIKEGMAATVHTDSFPGKEYPGWVGFISPVAEFTPKTVQTTDLRPKLVYETRIYVKDPDNELRLGMPVTVEVSASPSPKAKPSRPRQTPDMNGQRGQTGNSKESDARESTSK